MRFKITSDTPLTAERRTADIVALYVTGPADQFTSIERAVNAYARAFLGVSGHVSAGASFLSHGQTVEVQMIYVMRGPNRPDRFQHGQHVMYYPEWDEGDRGEEMIIEEVIDPDTHVAIRPLNSDAVFTVNPARLSSPFGAPCQCARVGGDAFPC